MQRGEGGYGSKPKRIVEKIEKLPAVFRFRASFNEFRAHTRQIEKGICFSFGKSEFVEVSFFTFFGARCKTSIDPLLGGRFVIGTHT